MEVFCWRSLPCFCFFPSLPNGMGTLLQPLKGKRAGLMKQHMKFALGKVTTPGASEGGSSGKHKCCLSCGQNGASLVLQRACDGVGGSPITAR